MTCYQRVMGIAANWAQILTAVVAVIFYVQYLWERCQKQARLESYLKEEKAKGDKGQRSLPHLVARLGMSESDILDAAFRSKRVHRVTDKDEDGFATKVMLVYIGE